MGLFSRWSKSKTKTPTTEIDISTEDDDITPWALDKARHKLKHARAETEEAIKKIREKRIDPLEELIIIINQGRNQ